MYSTTVRAACANHERGEPQIMSPRHRLFFRVKAGVAIDNRDATGSASDANVCSNAVVPWFQCRVVVTCSLETVRGIVSKRLFALRLARENEQSTLKKLLCGLSERGKAGNADIRSSMCVE